MTSHAHGVDADVLDEENIHESAKWLKDMALNLGCVVVQNTVQHIAVLFLGELDCQQVEGSTMRAWGELAYLKPLTEKQMEDYELRPAPGNPDRVARPSITAQLKEAARRAEPPKEPDKAKHNKSREDR